MQALKLLCGRRWENLGQNGPKVYKVSLWLSQPRQAKGPAHGGWHRAWEVFPWPTNVRSTKLRKAEPLLHEVKLDGAGRIRRASPAQTWIFRPKPLAQNMNKPFRLPDCKSAKVLLVELLKLRWLLANDFFKIFTWPVFKARSFSIGEARSEKGGAESKMSAKDHEN